MQVLLVVLLVLLLGCARSQPVTLARLPAPIMIEATRNYLPTVMTGLPSNPAYTIYEGSRWECPYQADVDNYACCLAQQISAMSPWKYCVVTDTAFQPFAFIELGANAQIPWPDGKQADVFRRVSP